MYESVKIQDAVHRLTHSQVKTKGPERSALLGSRQTTISQREKDKSSTNPLKIQEKK